MDKPFEQYSGEEKAGMFEYLEELRLSGVTNMFGAAPYLMEEFDLTHGNARKVLVAWMDDLLASRRCE